MSLQLERLEDRTMPSVLDSLLSALAPITALHYTPADNFQNGSYNAPGDPGSAGFNLVAVYSPQQLALVPAGDKALVDMGSMTNGVDANFLNAIKPYLGNPKVYGFYLADEPNPAVVPASNLKAESDWVHANDPGAKTFFVIGPGPLFQSFTPASTDMDLVGLDPYPIRTWGVNYGYIPEAVFAAELIGWSNSQIVPVYQTFGGKGSFVLPTAQQEQIAMAIWGALTPHPAFDYAYSWGDWSGTSLVDRPDLQVVFYDHNTDPPLNPIALSQYGLERLESDVFSRLAQVQPGFVGPAKQAQAAAEANPYNGTSLGNLIAEFV